MKAVTEFPGFTLKAALTTKATLTSEGKSAEEIQTSLGTTYKLEGDRLKHFMNALEVAGNNLENLKRVMVVSLAEGENAPSRAVKVEETYYVPDIMVPYVPKPPQKPGRGGGRGGRDGGRGEKRGAGKAEGGKGPKGDKGEKKPE